MGKIEVGLKKMDTFVGALVHLGVAWGIQITIV